MQLSCWFGWHQWGPVGYIDALSCEQHQLCVHCGASRLVLTLHTWSAWTYVSPTECCHMRTCLRCRSRETRLAHEYGAFLQDGAICARCGCVARKCVDCDGRGMRHDPDCPACGGDGYETDGLNGCWPCIRPDIACSTCQGVGTVWQSPSMSLV